MAEGKTPVDDVDVVRRQLRAAVIAKVRTIYRVRRRRRPRLVRLSHVGRPW